MNLTAPNLSVLVDALSLPLFLFIFANDQLAGSVQGYRPYSIRSIFLTIKIKVTKPLVLIAYN